MTYEPLHHKYRPQTFAQLVGQEAIATTLTNAIGTRRIAPAYLFTGPRGTGKTSSARILAKSLNCLACDVPTATPCGECDVCKGITKGATLDVIEIDAASNTGVDNIRDLIERAQFAPVQCRYKVYVIDECLTGDTLVKTREGLMRIDNPHLLGKEVLSYNENKRKWEFKKVLRWLDQGNKPTIVIKTTHREIRCTGNHLIQTNRGWIHAKDLKEGAKILSPVSVDVEPLFTNLGQMEESVDLSVAINSKATNTDKNLTTTALFWNKLKPFVLFVPADVEKNLRSQHFDKRKVRGFGVLNHTGSDIPINKDTDSGIQEPINFWQIQNSSHRNYWVLSTELYSEIVPSLTRINTVDFPDWFGHMEKSNGNGWNTKPLVFQNYGPIYEFHPTRDMEIYPFVVIQPVIRNLKKFLTLLNPMEIENKCLLTGSIELHHPAWLGGISTMDHFVFHPKEAQVSQFIQKDTHQKKINSLPVGLQTWDIDQQPNLIDDLTGIKFTITSRWEPIPAENGWQTSKNIPSLQWITSLERVESVQVAGIERVYDIEVEDNHNFVANGLSVHNCHMLSTAAFNSLLKTLEEPPDRVVFVLATTDPQRVLPTIISRCQRFDFRRIPLESMKNHLKDISIKENITIADDALFLVAQIAQGGLRDAESLLDQLSLLSGEITVEKVWDLVGAVPENDLMALLEALDQGDAQIVLDKVRHLMDRGREPLIVLQNLASFYRDLLIAKTAPNRSDLVSLTAPTWEKLSQFSHRWEMTIILAGQKHLQSSEYQIKNTTQPRLWLEITLLGLLPDALKTQAPVVQETRRVSSSPVPTPASIPTPTASPTPTSFTSEIRTPPTVIETPQNPIQSPPSTGENPPHFEPLSGDSDLIEIWQQLLNHLQPLGTQQLFKQHGRLIEFRDSFARVAMKSSPLLKIAQDKVVNLEAAFQRLFNRAIRVKLEGPGATESQKGKILDFPTQNRSLKEPFHPNPSNDHFRDQNVGAGSPMSLTNNPNTEKPPTIAPSTPLSLTNSPNTEPPRQQQNDHSVIKNQENAIGLNPEIVMKAAQEIARLFDGEIVDLKEFSESIPSRAVTGEAELTTEWTLPSSNPTTGGQGGEENSDLGEITIDNPLELDEEEDEMPF